VPTVLVHSKADLERASAAAPDGWLPVSCVTGEGLDVLRSKLADAVSGEVVDLGGEVAISRRHRQLLERASVELDRCDPLEAEVAAEALRWAERALAELIGEIAAADVLDEVFASFCIGK
jgi:tRNA modification GTPase